MADSIRISALGRDARVGDLYNFYTDVISPSLIEVPNECKTSSEALVDRTLLFFYQQPEIFKHHILGINSHLLQSINQGSVPRHQLWFANYLDRNWMDGDKQQTQVTLSFRVVRRIERLDENFLPSKIDEYHLRSDDAGATHVIEEVVYGMEAICSMSRVFDPSRETKESADFRLYLAAKKYFDEAIIKSSNVELPVELDNVSCNVLYSISPGKIYNCSLELFSRDLQSLLCSDTGSVQREWKPIQFLLRNIPVARIEARQLLDEKADGAFKHWQRGVTKQWIAKEIRDICTNPSLKRFPSLEKCVNRFCSLLALFWNKIEEDGKINETPTAEKVLKEPSISDLLDKIADWFAYRRKEVEEIDWLLRDTDLKLLDSEEIGALTEARNSRTTKLFIVKVEYQEDFLVDEIQKLVCQETSAAKLPVLPIFSCGKEQLESVFAALREFADEAKKAAPVAANGTSYHIELNPSASKNGVIVTKCASGKPPLNESRGNQVDYSKRSQNQQSFFDSFSVPAHQPNYSLAPIIADKSQLVKDTSSAEKSPDESLENTSMEFEELLTDVDSSDADVSLDKIQLMEPKSSTQQMHSGATINSRKDQTGHNYTVPNSSNISGRDSEIFNFQEDQNPRRTGQGNPPIHGRIAEIYAKSYSKLIKEGSPNVYLLDATEKLNGHNIKWFDIYRPGRSSVSADPQKHKNIILMGGTGSGKSTLINGMVNYILGVQWNDPFRFKCVREDDNVKNQAHSQTSSVTAYTLHHQDGMTIPHSITIIDTPGYGDTRGIQRDKEITANIHRFLTQQENPIDELHAVCFVAASGDSRLTATQRYIIDSVLAIFGKDMKENLRLLVTFADNALPPVVGACRDSNFPVTSTSNGISYSKFNSSVLYCSNVREKEDEFSFDQMFWDMGQENFQKFFAVLKEIKGCDLKSTREVVHSRGQLEQSLLDIEQEMEVCLTHIENIEILQMKVRTYGPNFEVTKNYFIEQTSLRPIKSKCPKGSHAYNCNECKNTCVRGITNKNFSREQKKSCSRKECKCLPMQHSLDPWEWRLDRETASTTLLDTKAKYENNSRHPMTIAVLLNSLSKDLHMAKAKVLSLLDEVAKNVKLLESTALRSNVLSTSDYLSLMRSRVLEELKPGYQTRVETLDELQKMLAGDTSQQRPFTVTNEKREPSYTQQYSEGAFGSSADSFHYEESSKTKTYTQPTPAHHGQEESKTSKSWLSWKK